MPTKLNFNDYDTHHKFILKLRDTDPKFLELDNRVRALAPKVGKGTATKAEETEYKKKETERNKILTAFAAANTPTPPEIQFSAETDAGLVKSLTVYCNKFPNANKKNIVMTGATGTGKTYCAKKIGEILQQKGFRVYFTNTYNLVKRMRENAFGADTVTFDRDLFETDLLIIDDLGAEPEHKNSAEYIYTAINERYENGKPFIITTNLSTEQIRAVYDERICSRILDIRKTATIKVEGKDFRIE